MKNILLSITALLLAVFANGQRIKLISGNASALKGETKINVVFTYEKMRVGKFEDEADYIKYKKEEYDKKEPGRGDKWEQAWIDDRAGRFEPNFIEMFEKYTPFAAGNYSDAKYTMIVNTTRTEPGYNIYISKKNAEIDLYITIQETATKKTIAEYTVKNAPGRTFGGYDYETGQRIEESYATAGKHFGKELKGDIK